MMQRNLARISSSDYDLVIVGGGIFGICVAWDAVLRGLSVALLEKADFGHAASANCFKMIHGGIRYLQHADIVRLRHSAAESRLGPCELTPGNFRAVRKTVGIGWW